MGASRKPKPSAAVGIDIGSDSIKVAEAKLVKGSVTITGVGVARCPEGVIENEVVIDPKALGAAIKALLSESGIKTKKCVSSVAGQSRVVVRVLNVPKMNPKELGETMKWEVERVVPFSPNQVVMDYKPLEKLNEDPNAQNMDVFLAVAQQELVESHVAAIQAAGLTPTAIDIEPLAVGRSLVDAAPNVKDEVVAVVHIGANTSELCMFEGGVPVGMPIPLGISGTLFTKEIAESLGQTEQQAELTKREYAMVDLAAYDAAQAPAVDMGAFGGQDDADGPSAFNTVVDGSTGAFDLNFGGASEPQADAQSADPSNPFVSNPFSQASDSGPAFDLPQSETTAAEPFSIPETELGASFDQSAETPAPVDNDFLFNIGGEDTSDSGNAFDLGGAEPAQTAPSAPLFDLGDDMEDSPAEEDQSQPNFDLSDTDENADPGTQFDFEPALPVAAIGDPVKFDDKVKQCVYTLLGDLIAQLRNSLDYYSTQYSKYPGTIYICGGTAKLQNLEKLVEREIGVPTKVADPIKNLGIKIAGVSEQYLKEISPMLCVSVGLAIRDMVD